MMGGLSYATDLGRIKLMQFLKNSLKTKQETGYIGNGEQL